jgi:thiamine-monophosphate kinase
MDERFRIARIAHLFAGEAGTKTDSARGRNAAGIELGIGDDAAVLDPREAPFRLQGEAPFRLVWTIDEQVEGTHFRLDLASFRDIGWRSFMAAASDIAAMGAAPWCALGALVLPDSVDDAAFEEVLCGQRDAAAAVGAPLVGGNLARGPALSIATTFLGTAAHAVRRRGAVPGDGVWVAGPLGLAAAGLRALLTGRGDETALAAAVGAWRRPVALIAAGRAMAPLAHAAVDVSDGLARDAGHIAEASGVSVVFDEAALCADSILESAAAALGVPALELALYGGEDYALVVASPAPIEGFRRVGDVVAGSGIALRSARGIDTVEARGFDHFAPVAAAKGPARAGYP